MDGKPSPRGAWSGHVNHLNFGGIKINHISGTADCLRCYQLRWTVSVVNWWSWRSRSPVYHTITVCQRHRRLVSFWLSGIQGEAPDCPDVKNKNGQLASQASNSLVTVPHFGIMGKNGLKDTAFTRGDTTRIDATDCAERHLV